MNKPPANEASKDRWKRRITPKEKNEDGKINDVKDEFSEGVKGQSQNVRTGQTEKEENNSTRLEYTGTHIKETTGTVKFQHAVRPAAVGRGTRCH